MERSMRGPSNSDSEYCTELISKIFANRSNCEDIDVYLVPTINNDLLTIRIPGHKLILRSSPYLANLIKTNEAECFQTPLELQLECDQNSIELILKYIYTGQVDSRAANLIKLLGASRQFQLPRLTQKCLKILIEDDSNLQVENWLELFRFAVSEDGRRIRQKIFEFMRSISSQLIESEDLLSLDFNEVKILLEPSNRIFPTHKDFNKVILNWVTFQAERREHVEELSNLKWDDTVVVNLFLSDNEDDETENLNDQYQNIYVLDQHSNDIVVLMDANDDGTSTLDNNIEKNLRKKRDLRKRNNMIVKPIGRPRKSLRLIKKSASLNARNNRNEPTSRLRPRTKFTSKTRDTNTLTSSTSKSKPKKSTSNMTNNFISDSKAKKSAEHTDTQHDFAWTYSAAETEACESNEAGISQQNSSNFKEISGTNESAKTPKVSINNTSEDRQEKAGQGQGQGQGQRITKYQCPYTGCNIETIEKCEIISHLKYHEDLGSQIARGSEGRFYFRCLYIQCNVGSENKASLVDHLRTTHLETEYE